MSSPFKHRTAADSAQHLSRHQKFRRKHDGSPVPSPVPSPAAATPGGSGTTPDVTMAPRGLTVLQFMEARALELNSLLHSAQRLHGPRHALQSLPRHMRRRAVSHNPKRLPRRLREVSARKMLQSLQPMLLSLQPGQEMEKSRRPRTFYRRRAANRRADFSRRQGHVTWLETHVWHAKRFHMVNRWGYRLPDHPSDKSLRAAYRAMVHHCLIQDISYYGCIELTGPQDNVLRLLAHFTHKDTGDFCSVSSSEGSVEGSATLYRCDCCPHQVLGPVTYMVRSQKGQGEDPSAVSSCQLWLWTHPACTMDILQELQQISHTGVRVLSIGHELARFRLNGHLAAATLEAALNLSPLHNDTSRPGQVLSLTVEDPRINMPSRRAKVPPLAPCDPADPVGVQTNAELGDHHELGDADSRKKFQTPPERHGRRCREERDAVGVTGDNRRVAGGNSHVAGDNGRVPILLVHQQGRTADRAAASALGTGWDVIMPAGWAMVFWLGFIYRGARAGGLREMRRLHLETGQLFFPDDFPDTGAYRTLQQEQAAKLREQHDRYPPGKRPNFARLGTAAPFHCPWERLVAGWAQLAGTESPGQPQGAQLAGTETSGQLQGAQLAGTETSGQPQGAQLAGTETSGQPQGAQLAGTETSGQLQGAQLAGTETSGQPQGAQLAGTETSGQLQGAQLAGTETSGQPRGLCVARDSRIRKQLSQLCRHGDRSHADHPELVPVLTYLVAVRLRMVSRGTPVAMAMICAPTADDVSGGVAGGAACDPVEPAHPEGRTSDDCDVVRHCSRLTLGYVSAGANSLSLGRGVGVGLCALQGLLGVLQLQGQGQPPVVLVRNPNSAQYRFAHLTIL
ncbi:ribonucleases P/MRP protein subunit POP1-like [Branchiostoma floridae]|uniref:Ribonucleases P/MRP protein subunit POP1-like n=1 Tax=Branchiostoma floridae TaxID=7739 RepID=A0A9J7MSJ9_BRAFL|nr:ribonucleases P/MRP protein subunit POP1-like [Branchiostoma floridae]